jgi:hypothetical protein
LSVFQKSKAWKHNGFNWHKRVFVIGKIKTLQPVSPRLRSAAGWPAYPQLPAPPADNSGWAPEAHRSNKNHIIWISQNNCYIHKFCMIYGNINKVPEMSC